MQQQQPKLTPIELIALDALRKWGCPVHTDYLIKLIRKEFPKKNHKGLYTEETIRTTYNKLAHKGLIRKLRRAVYSAYGPERD